MGKEVPYINVRIIIFYVRLIATQYQMIKIRITLPYIIFVQAIIEQDDKILTLVYVTRPRELGNQAFKILRKDVNKLQICKMILLVFKIDVPIL